MAELQDTPFPSEMRRARIEFRQPAFTNTDNVHICRVDADATLCGIRLVGGSVKPQWQTTTCEPCAAEARRLVKEAPTMLER